MCEVAQETWAERKSQTEGKVDALQPSSNTPTWIPPRRKNMSLIAEEESDERQGRKRQFPFDAVYGRKAIVTTTTTTSTTTTTLLDESTVIDIQGAVEEHIARERSRVRELREQQRATSDRLLHEAVERAVAEHGVGQSDQKAELLLIEERVLWVVSLLIKGDSCSAFIGDLEEKVASFTDRKAARNWLFRQILKSLPPLLWREVRRAFRIDALISKIGR